MKDSKGHRYNDINLIDDMNFIRKEVEIQDDIKLQYSDDLHHMEKDISFLSSMHFSIKLMYEAFIDLFNDSDGKRYNEVTYSDVLTLISKKLGIKDDLKLSCNDELHYMEKDLKLNNNTMLFYDKEMYEAFIDLIKDSENKPYNEITYSDIINYIESHIDLVSRDSNNSLTMTDIIGATSEVSADEKATNGARFRDKIRYFYSE